jgi:hypothetical protein
MSTPKSETYVPHPPHSLTPEAKEFLESLSPRYRALQNLAILKLGSSHFVEKTHAFTAWKKSGATTPKK